MKITKTLELELSWSFYFLPLRDDESYSDIALCTDFVNTFFGITKDTRDVRVTVTNERPHQKGWVRIDLCELPEGSAPISDVNYNCAVNINGKFKDDEMHHLCYAEYRWLKRSGFGDRFYIKVEKI